jgi:hypothetical protein
MHRPILALSLIGALLPAGASAAEVQLQIANGQVTLIATDAPLRQILAEWERVGGTRIVNADRVSGPPITIQLQQVTEQEALGVLLRSVAGYLAAPRRAGSAAVSVYESVMILPTSTPPAAPSAPAAAQRGPAFPAAGPRPFPPQPFPAQPELPQPVAIGDEQGPAAGFITVGNARTPRQPQTPGSGRTVTTGPGFPPAINGWPGLGVQPGTPNGVPPPRPGVVQPGIVMPDDGPPEQDNPNLQP